MQLVPVATASAEKMHKLSFSDRRSDRTLRIRFPASPARGGAGGRRWHLSFGGPKKGGNFTTTLEEAQWAPVLLQEKVHPVFVVGGGGWGVVRKLTYHRRNCATAVFPDSEIDT